MNSHKFSSEERPFILVDKLRHSENLENLENEGRIFLWRCRHANARECTLYVFSEILVPHEDFVLRLT